MPTLEDARNTLTTVWGYPDFRSGQDDVVRAVLTGKDVLAVLPTGGGKSICYQVPSLLLPGLTLVVTPLIALMKDQVEGLERRKVQAVALHSGLSAFKIDQILTNAEFGAYELLYVSPERLETERFRARADRLNVSLIAVDEAHCISEWGEHFRPSYRKIFEARELLGSPPLVAVTATATPAVRKDIREQLRLRDPIILVRGFDRPNIRWAVFETENKIQKVKEILEAVPGPGIVYAATRRHVESWAARLVAEGIPAEPYHAGLDTDRRSSVQNRWLRDSTRCIVATNAFGMGIDKPDVRWVIHVDLPGSIEAYYQEAGRAGRDGKGSYAVLLWQRSDEQLQANMTEAGLPDAERLRTVYDAVCNHCQIPVGSLPDDAIWINLQKLAKRTGLRESVIKSAIDTLSDQEFWQPLPVSKNRIAVRFRQSAERLHQYARSLENKSVGEFLISLLRTVHADAFSSWYEADVIAIEKATGLERDRLYRGFNFLQSRDILAWHPPEDSLRLIFIQPRVQRARVDDSSAMRARKRATAQLADIVLYAQSITCRRQFLLSYFGERAPERCGSCDICLKRHDPMVITREDEANLRRILSAIENKIDRDEWFSSPAPPVHKVDGLLAWLYHEGYIYKPDPLSPRYALTPVGEKKVKI